MITLSLLYRLLRVDESEGINALVQAAYRTSYYLPALVVSAAEQEGLQLGSGSADLLRRTRRRAEDYEQLYEMLSAGTQVRRLKGQELAKGYPPGFLRPVGDLDLVAADAADAWQAAREIVKHRPVSEVDLTVFDVPERHLLLHFEWAPVDGILDPLANVDLCTAAYAERLGVLPVCVEMPANSWLANFLAIAEERFQRPFNAKDMVDVLVLSKSMPRADEIIRTVESWDLAPEVAELLGHAGHFFELGPFEEVYQTLRPQSVTDRGQRGHNTQPPADEPKDPAERLRQSLPVFGMRLGELTMRQERQELELHHFDHGVLAQTPLGDYLLVGQERVDPELYERALAEIAK